MLQSPFVFRLATLVLLPRSTRPHLAVNNLPLGVDVGPWVDRQTPQIFVAVGLGLVYGFRALQGRLWLFLSGLKAGVEVYLARLLLIVVVNRFDDILQLLHAKHLEAGGCSTQPPFF